MGDKDDKSGGRGNDWEVVSLTASAYAAAPGPKPPLQDLTEVSLTRHEAETSHPLYMSRHFVFPSSEPSNKMDSGFSFGQETGKEVADLNLKGLDLSDEFDLFEDKGKRGEDDFMTSLHDDRAIGGSHVYEHNEPIHDPVTPSVVVPDASPDLNPAKDDKHQVANVNDDPPCEAWWKRSAASLISQAKETNTVWSIFIAATVMGIVILGQHWQHERWQLLQLKWESTIGNEKAGRLMGPISRLKQAFVGGHRRESFIRASSQNDS